jgi:hypothetical protein
VGIGAPPTAVEPGARYRVPVSSITEGNDRGRKHNKMTRAGERMKMRGENIRLINREEYREIDQK